MNRYKLIKIVIASVLVIIVVGGYTYLGIYSESAILGLCAIALWLCIILYSIIFLFLWLTKKESELKRVLVMSEYNVTKDDFDQFVIIQKISRDYIEIESCDCVNTVALEIRRKQAIAIAKHFNLTSKELDND